MKFLVGDVLRNGDDVGQLGRVVGGKFGDVGVVLLGHHEHVDLGLGIDVVECVGRLVLVDLAAGNLPCDDLAEQAIVGFRSSCSLV